MLLSPAIKRRAWRGSRRSETSPPAWPDPNANRSCTYPPTGPGNPPGSPCGTTPSADDPAPKPPPTRPDNQDPDRKSWADQRPTHAATSHNQDQPLNPPTQGLSVESGLVSQGADPLHSSRPPVVPGFLRYFHG